MSVYFFDSSATVKRYINEVGTDWVTSLADPASNNRIHVAGITGAEVVSAIARRARGGNISENDAAAAIALFRHHFSQRYVVAAISSVLISSAMQIGEKYALRGYDAVQLAAALELKADCIALGVPGPVLVSADSELNIAATAEGFTTDNPNIHP